MFDYSKPITRSQKRYIRNMYHELGISPANRKKYRTIDRYEAEEIIHELQDQMGVDKSDIIEHRKVKSKYKYQPITPI